MQEKCTFESHAVNLHNKETKKLKFPARSWTAIPFCHQRGFISVNKPNSHVTLPVPFIALVVPFAPYIFIQTERMCKSQWIRIGTSFGENCTVAFREPLIAYTRGWWMAGWRMRRIPTKPVIVPVSWHKFPYHLPPSFMKLFTHINVEYSVSMHCDKRVLKVSAQSIYNIWMERKLEVHCWSFVCGYPINIAVIPETN